MLLLHYFLYVKVSECSAAEKWERTVQSAVTTLLGIEAAEWTQTLVVDIISSNRTSVVDLMSPYTHLPENRRRIMEWAEKVGVSVDMNFSGSGAGGGDADSNADNRYYVMADKYFAAHPKEAIERGHYDRERGIMSVDEREYTGISVQILYMDKLLEEDNNSGINCDSVLKQAMRDNHKPSNQKASFTNATSSGIKKHVIVNIDYAFGEQAEHVLWSLLNLFSLSVRSVNVMGKVSFVPLFIIYLISSNL